MLVAALLPSSRCATCPHQRSRFGGVGLCKAGKNIAVASSDVMFLLSELNNFGENWKVLTRARFIFSPSLALLHSRGSAKRRVRPVSDRLALAKRLRWTQSREPVLASLWNERQPWAWGSLLMWWVKGVPCWGGSRGRLGAPWPQVPWAGMRSQCRDWIHPLKNRLCLAGAGMPSSLATVLGDAHGYF